MSLPSEADLLEATVVVPLLEERLREVRTVIVALPPGTQREQRHWEADRLRRRLRYWRLRRTRIAHQLQEVSDDYPVSYLRVMRAAADHGRTQRGRSRQR